jgi:hypothetical protein
MSDNLNVLLRCHGMVRMLRDQVVEACAPGAAEDDSTLTRAMLLVNDLAALRSGFLRAGLPLGVNPIEMGRFLDHLLECCYNLAIFSAAGADLNDDEKKEQEFWVALQDLKEALAPMEYLLDAYDTGGPEQRTDTTQSLSLDGPARDQVSVDTPRPKWNRPVRQLTVDRQTISIATKEAPRQFAVLDLLETAGWPPAGLAVPRDFRGSLKDAVEALNDKLAATHLRILRLDNDCRLGWMLITG